MRVVRPNLSKPVLYAAFGAVCAAGLAAAPSGAFAATGGNSNKGDVWVDNVGNPPGPGHEMDPHLACADINLWGSGLADASGTYTIDGWPPSGSQEQDYPASGTAAWTYNTAAGGSQVTSVISVQTLINNAIANGDAVHNKQGFHFKLEFSQDPQKHKTFWVQCPGPVVGTTTLTVQTLDSCRQAVGGATFTLLDAGGNVVGTQTAAPGGPKSVASGGTCPIQAGNCVSVPIGCVSFTVNLPASGTETFTLKQTAAPSGYVPCEGGSACQSETTNFVVDSAGDVQATTTNVYPDGFVATFPTTDPTTGFSFWEATPTDPALVYDEKLGTVSCDGDSDADDNNSGVASAHCDSDAD